MDSKKMDRALKTRALRSNVPTGSSVPDFFIAYRMYAPSYVSLEAALSHYSIIPEVSMAVTSITTKPTRRFRNKHGLFIFHTVRPHQFTGYTIEKQGAFEILIAEPEKALADWVYFRSYRSKKWSPAGERLDRQVIRRLDRRKFASYMEMFGLEPESFYAFL